MDRDPGSRDRDEGRSSVERAFQEHHERADQGSGHQQIAEMYAMRDNLTADALPRESSLDDCDAEFEVCRTQSSALYATDLTACDEWVMECLAGGGLVGAGGCFVGGVLCGAFSFGIGAPPCCIVGGLVGFVGGCWATVELQARECKRTANAAHWNRMQVCYAQRDACLRGVGIGCP